MNRKQRVLTIIAIVIFVIIGWIHYIAIKPTYSHDGWYLAWVDPSDAIIPDVRVPWFMLGVIYSGLFFLLADKKEKRP